MQATEEATEVVSVEELREQALNALKNEHAPTIDDEALESLKCADSYTTLFASMSNVLHSIRDTVDRLVVMRWFDPIEVQAMQQLARIEREHEASTSLQAMRDRVNGILEKFYSTYQSNHWDLKRERISSIETYSDLIEFVGPQIIRFASWPDIVEQLSQIRDLLWSKLSPQWQ